MPRQVRTDYEDSAYHVMARGNRRQDIAFNDSDRELFAETLARGLRTGEVQDLRVGPHGQPLPQRPAKGDWRKVAIARPISERTTVRQDWNAERLNLKSASNVSERVRQYRLRV